MANASLQPLAEPSAAGKVSLRPNLNWDILVSLIPHLFSPSPHGAIYDRRGSLASYMSTCRALYQLGAPFLLRGCVVIGPTLEKARSLCLFVQKDPRRARLIRELSISGGDEDEEVEAAVAELVRQAHNVEDLRLIPECESVLVEWPSIIPAISSLRNIKHLEVDYFGERTIELIRAIRSPIASVQASFHCGDDLNPDYSYLFQHISDTLETLDISDFDGDVLSPTVFQEATFPRLRTLAIESCASLDLEAVMDAFPSLQHLNWVCRSSEDCRNPDEALENRQESSFPGAGQTRSMRQLSAGVRACYCSAMMLQVHHWLTGEVRPWEEPLLRVVMETIRPTALSVDLNLRDFKDEEFPGLFPFPFVEHMDLTVHLDRCTTPASIAINERIMDGLQHMPLVELNLVLEHWNGFLGDKPKTRTARDLPTVDYLEDMDAVAYVQSLSARIPTLEKALIHFKSPWMNIRPSVCVEILHDRSTGIRTAQARVLDDHNLFLIEFPASPILRL